MADARHWAREILRSWDADASTVDTVVLLVSELATNAVVHAKTGFEVSMSAEATGLRTDVSDGDQSRPIAREPSPTSLSGRGLHLVRTMSDAFGVSVYDDGKSVWFELRT